MPDDSRNRSRQIEYQHELQDWMLRPKVLPLIGLMKWEVRCAVHGRNWTDSRLHPDAMLKESQFFWPDYFFLHNEV